MDKGFAVLEIDPEFKTLIRPLRKDEYLQLEVNLTVDGCREPIITWNNIIIDGHNRYEICNRLHIPYAVRKMPFENREQAIVWICSNQLGRRNITEETRRSAHSFSFDFSIYQQVFLIADGMLKACPEVHSDCTELYLHRHMDLFFRKEYRQPDRQVQTAIAIWLRV